MKPIRVEDIFQIVEGLGKRLTRLENSRDSDRASARAYNSANISTTSGSDEVLTFNSERFNDSGMHNTSSNTSRLTAHVDDVYKIGCSVVFASNSTGYRQVILRLNGITNIGGDTRPAVNGQDTIINVNVTYQLAVGDYVEVLARQTSGGALNVRALGNTSPEFWMVRGG